MSSTISPGSSLEVQWLKDSEVNPFQLLQTLRASFPARPGSIHSCSFCAVQELDPLIKVQIEEQLYDVAIIKYRGLRCIQGAINGCALFQEFISLLVRELNTRGYDANSPAAHIDPERWVCQLHTMISVFPDDLQRIGATWKSSKDQLPPISSHNSESPYSVYWLTTEESMWVTARHGSLV